MPKAKLCRAPVIAVCESGLFSGLTVTISVVALPRCGAVIDLTQQSAYLIGRNPSGNRGH